ncbi:twin-arginine translocation signal domain-containing protein [uncultured Deinococcus sp.]|uniref:twin-arginine translocation signal domain-containing protein n=1 Tax=uncultured Deinococcus sp. TaxID=158789 RepID=UPI0025EFC35A|nr:twin-arginine translocation signal domain-containing protein [uncultured Deinococcus sp.]
MTDQPTVTAHTAGEASSTNRRSLLKHLTATGVGLGLSGLASSALAGGAPGPMKMGLNEKTFRMGVIGPAELSLITSQIAVARATNANAREFARFELREAIAVTTVLKELKTPVPPMDAKARATLARIQSAPDGKDFDTVYIMAQHDNHVFLQQLATAYLANTTPNEPTFPEQQGRHLATLALNQFTEHVELTARILKELQA